MNIELAGAADVTALPWATLSGQIKHDGGDPKNGHHRKERHHKSSFPHEKTIQNCGNVARTAKGSAAVEGFSVGAAYLFGRNYATPTALLFWLAPKHAKDVRPQAMRVAP